MSETYQEFLRRKEQEGSESGFAPTWMPDELFDFQKVCVEWAIQKGRGALFEDCGLGKTAQQLVWAENVARHTGGKVLVLTPLAVSFQTVQEGAKFGVECVQRRDNLHSSDRVVVTNYERLHHFDPTDFDGVVCDESSILKNFDGSTRAAVTDFMRKIPYRLLCTATAAPNDYIELGTSSEALGYSGAQDVINRFFKKAKNTTSAHHERMSGVFALRPHATEAFWRWVCSWARAIRRPSDVGCEDGAFDLPALSANQHTVKASAPRDGYLFDVCAVGLQEQRADLRRTIGERCEKAAEIINGRTDPSIAWCNLNDEGDMMESMIPGAVQVSGKDSDEKKEEAFLGFAKGDIRVLVTKPSIGGFGLNFQHCAHQTYFPSHSYEQYYQCVRRSWRFGQTRPVTVDMITTDGQQNVLSNLQRKTNQAEDMFSELVAQMNNELSIQKKNEHTKGQVMPSWL